MANPTTMSVVFSLALLFQILCFRTIHGAQKSNGFSFSLIHPHSPESPVYKPNLTDEERMNDLIQMSNIRAESLANYILNIVSNTKNNHNSSFRSMVFRPSMSYQYYLYLVKVGVGTFDSAPPFISYYMNLDTGSDLIWLQCQGCDPDCYHQVEPYFPSLQSKTFKQIVLPCEGCPQVRCQGNPCTIERRYGDGSSVYTILATESFTLESDGDHFVTLQNVVFGCGVHMRDFRIGDNPDNKISGYMGMNYGELSLAAQLKPSYGRLSYCFQPMPAQGEVSPMFLRFGDDVIQRPGMYSTPMPKQSSIPLYYLNLQAISVANRRLDIDPQVFQIRPDHGGGTIIDSGTGITMIVSQAYTIMEAAIIRFIEANNPNLRRVGPTTAFNVCYERFKGSDTVYLPGIVFHFENNADFVVQKTASFYIGEVICWAMAESPTYLTGLTILGGYQQTNQRIIYDLANGQLLFKPEDCSMGN